jgi:hypothetical protein
MTTQSLSTKDVLAHLVSSGVPRIRSVDVPSVSVVVATAIKTKIDIFLAVVFI